MEEIKEICKGVKEILGEHDEKNLKDWISTDDRWQSFGLGMLSIIESWYKGDMLK